MRWMFSYFTIARWEESVQSLKTKKNSRSTPLPDGSCQLLKVCNKHSRTASMEIVLVSLMLTLNRNFWQWVNCFLESFSLTWSKFLATSKRRFWLIQCWLSKNSTVNASFFSHAKYAWMTSASLKPIPTI